MVSLDQSSWHLSILFLIIAGLGVGGIVVPASIITNIICPDELIATVTALTLAIRVLGGAIGYSIYYNVFLNHFKVNVVQDVGYVSQQIGIKDPTVIGEIIALTGAGLLKEIRGIPGVNTDQEWEALVAAGQMAYAKSYPYVYYVSIAFGSVSIIACLFLKNIDMYMNDHIAVKYDGGASSTASSDNVARPQPAHVHNDTAAIHHDPGHVSNEPVLNKETVA
jgi:MFS family permease